MDIPYDLMDLFLVGAVFLAALFGFCLGTRFVGKYVCAKLDKKKWE